MNITRLLSPRSIVGMIGILSGVVSYGQSMQEISIHAATGISAINYVIGIGDRKNNIGAKIGADYKHALSYRLSIELGWEFAFYRTNLQLNNFETSSMANDLFHEFEPFEFRNKIKNYEENQTVTILQIPLMLNYLIEGDLIFVTAGVKFGVPISGKFTSSAEQISNSGYYAEEHHDYPYPLSQGFGTFENRQNKGDLRFKSVVFLSLEIGLKSTFMSSNKAIYSCLYLDYGLNNFADPKPEIPFVEFNFNNPRDFTFHSVAYSSFNHGNTQQSFVEKINPIAAGIKIRFALGR